MKIKQVFVGAIVTAGLMGLSSTSAFATFINFDQNTQSATGQMSYDAPNGALIGQDITFSFVSSNEVATDYSCQDCLLSFETGALSSRSGPNDTQYNFNGGGSFSLTGTVLSNADNSTVASGTLIDNGQFVGEQTFTQVGDNSGKFDGNGSNTVNDDLAALFGLDSGLDYMFLNSTFNTGSLTFSDDGSFSGEVTGADLQTIANTPGTPAVPEPSELSLLGLGLAMLLIGVGYRRKSGRSIG